MKGLRGGKEKATQKSSPGREMADRRGELRATGVVAMGPAPKGRKLKKEFIPNP